MNTQLAAKESTAVVEARTQADSFMAMIERAATNPDVDIDKMERLYDMSKDMMNRRAMAEYNAAMTIVQAAAPAIKKSAWNDQTKSYYAKLEDIINAMRPIYTENGFSLSYSEGDAPADRMVRILLDVSHTGGDVRRFHYDNPIDDAGIKGSVNKTPTHGKSSAVSYGQRYLMNLVFMLDFSGQDDDGNGASTIPYERITDEQALEIESLITDNELDIGAIKAWMVRAMAVEHIADIPADSYKTTLNKVKATIKAKQS